MKLPSTTAASLEGLTAALAKLAELAPERMTVRQALFLTSLAHREAMGHTATVPLIREDRPVLKRAGEKHKECFLAATPRHPDALGWVEQEYDEGDRRMRYLKLTPEGREVVTALTAALAKP
jgi:hypothetical protein